jgi:hypothetical protein
MLDWLHRAEVTAVEREHRVGPMVGRQRNIDCVSSV